MVALATDAPPNMASAKMMVTASCRLRLTVPMTRSAHTKGLRPPTRRIRGSRGHEMKGPLKGALGASPGHHRAPEAQKD